MVENLPNLKKEAVIPVQESQKGPIKMKPKTSTPRHVTEISKVKENLKELRKTTCHIQGKHSKAMSRFFSRNSKSEESGQTHSKCRKKRPMI